LHPEVMLLQIPLKSIILSNNCVSYSSPLSSENSFAT
jgi:hypothetical protein